MVSDVRFRVVRRYTANAVPVMKTGISCAHILTGKTFSYHRDYYYCRDFPVFPLFYPVGDCSVRQCDEKKADVLDLCFNLFVIQQYFIKDCMLYVK